MGRKTPLQKTEELCRMVSATSGIFDLVGLGNSPLGRWLYYRRRTVAGGKPLSKDEEKVLIEHGVPNLFSMSASELNDRCLTIAYEGWVKAKGTEPGNNPENPEEYHLYRWVKRKRGSNAIARAVPELFPNLFDTPLPRSEKSLVIAQQVIDWVLLKGSAPRVKAPGYEGKLGRWLANKRAFYKRKGTQDVVYPLLLSLDAL
jgi:hypothetical protein